MPDIIDLRREYLNRAERLKRKRDSIAKYFGKIPEDRYKALYDQFQKEKEGLQKFKNEIEKRMQRVSIGGYKKEIPKDPETYEDYMAARQQYIDDIEEFTKLAELFRQQAEKMRIGQKVPGFRDLEARYYKTRKELKQRKEHLESIADKY